MAVTAVATSMAGAINYTFTTDTSADFASVANSTYFYNKADKLVRYKDATGAVLEIFSASGGASGIFGISNSSGVYTYYATLTLAMAAAVSGQVIEMFANYTETGAVTITLKTGVTISGNGYTYTLNNTGGTNAFTVTNGTSIECSILNLNLVRTGGSAGQSSNCGLWVGASTTGNIYLNDSKFTNLGGNGSGIGIGNLSTVTIYNGYAYANSDKGSIYFESGAGARAINCMGISNTGIGIMCYSGGDLYRCYGYSNTSTGIDGSGFAGIGSQYDCTGVSVGGAGFQAGVLAVNCTGRSTTYHGLSCVVSNSKIYSSVGFSVSGRGVNNSGVNAMMYNCQVTSSSNVGALLQSSGGSLYNCVVQSDSSYSLWGWPGSNAYNSIIICNWNNAGGYGVLGNAGITTPIINCVFKLSNATAPYLFNGGTAQAITMRGNTYSGGGAFNANLTQAIVNTEDNQGNIYL